MTEKKKKPTKVADMGKHREKRKQEARHALEGFLFEFEELAKDMRKEIKRAFDDEDDEGGEGA